MTEFIDHTYFDSHNFLESELIRFCYDSKAGSVDLIVDYRFEWLTNFLTKQEDKKHPEYNSDIRRLVFFHVEQYERQDVYNPSFSPYINCFETIAPTTIQIEQLQVESTDRGMMITINFFNGFGSCAFLCKAIRLERILITEEKVGDQTILIDKETGKPFALSDYLKDGNMS